MTIFTSMTSTHKLAGFVALSGYLVLGEKAKEMGNSEDSPNQGTPIFMGNGDADPLVKHEWAASSANLLKKWGRSVDFRTYK
jgi:predicted esterase